MTLEIIQPVLVKMIAGPACMLEPVYQVRLFQGLILRARVFLHGTKPQGHESSLHHPGVTCFCGPGRFSKLLSDQQIKYMNGNVMLTMHGKDFGIQLTLLFSCSVLDFDLPYATVSKDQGLSITI